MIVRISGEDQYRLDDADRPRLNALDEALVAAVEAGDEDGFRARFGELLGFVRDRGRLVGDDELEGSDVILPPPDTTLAEAASEFTGEGLIPE